MNYRSQSWMSVMQRKLLATTTATVHEGVELERSIHQRGDMTKDETTGDLVVDLTDMVVMANVTIGNRVAQAMGAVTTTITVHTTSHHMESHQVVDQTMVEDTVAVATFHRGLTPQEDQEEATLVEDRTQEAQVMDRLVHLAMVRSQEEEAMGKDQLAVMEPIIHLLHNHTVDMEQITVAMALTMPTMVRLHHMVVPAVVAAVHMEVEARHRHLMVVALLMEVEANQAAQAASERVSRDHGARDTTHSRAAAMGHHPQDHSKAVTQHGDKELTTATTAQTAVPTRTRTLVAASTVEATNISRRLLC